MRTTWKTRGGARFVAPGGGPGDFRQRERPKRQADLGGSAFPSRAWERGHNLKLLILTGGAKDDKRRRCRRSPPCLGASLGLARGNQLDRDVRGNRLILRALGK